MYEFMYKPGRVGAEIVEPVGVREDDETKVNIAENREFMCLLQ